MATLTLYRFVTCPVCETVLQLERPELDEKGREIYKLPAHVTWLGVNACMLLEVTIALGPVRNPRPVELVAGVRWNEDGRRFR